MGSSGYTPLFFKRVRNSFKMWPLQNVAILRVWKLLKNQMVMSGPNAKNVQQSRAKRRVKIKKAPLRRLNAIFYAEIVARVCDLPK